MSSDLLAVSAILRTPDDDDETDLAGREAVRGALDTLSIDETCEMEVRAGQRTLFVHALGGGIVSVTLLRKDGRPAQMLVGSPGERGATGMRHGNGEDDSIRARYATRNDDARKALDYFLDHGEADPSLTWEHDDGTGVEDDDDDC